MSKSNLFVALISLVVSLFFAELVLRAFASQNESTNPHQLFCEYDPLLGWRKTPHAEGRHITPEYDIVEKMNSHGIRGPEYPLEKDSGEYRILVLGDSFAEGYTVDFEELFSEKMKARLNADCPGKYEVINSGTGGWSTDQELLYFENHGAEYQPDLTILFFCTNDPWYNIQPKYWRGSKPLFVMDGDSLRLTNVPVPTLSDLSFYEKTKTWGLENSEFLRSLKRAKDKLKYASAENAVPDEWLVFRKDDLPEVEKSWEVTAALLRRLRQKTEAAGSKLLVFYIPEKTEIHPRARERFFSEYSLNPDFFDLGKPARKLSGTCDSLHIPLIDPTREFIARAKADSSQYFYFEKDWHWNQAGHAVVGEVLGRYLGCPAD